MSPTRLVYPTKLFRVSSTTANEFCPETRARVEAAIDELGYRPNAMARSMARGRSGVLACIAPNLTDYTFASMIDGAEQEARKRGYFLLSASAMTK